MQHDFARSFAVCILQSILSGCTHLMHFTRGVLHLVQLCAEVLTKPVLLSLFRPAGYHA